MRLTITALAAFGLLFATQLPAQQTREKKQNGQGAQDATVVFKRQCASCHGADGAGQTSIGKAMKLRDLRSDEVQNMSNQELFDTINKGKGKMPAYANLGHDTVHALVKHIRGFKGEKK